MPEFLSEDEEEEEENVNKKKQKKKPKKVEEEEEGDSEFDEDDEEEDWKEVESDGENSHLNDAAEPLDRKNENKKRNGVSLAKEVTKKAKSLKQSRTEEIEDDGEVIFRKVRIISEKKEKTPKQAKAPKKK